ncbi:hypothetical protein K788_0003766 [Paraburkholderia caribensis MBA4]|uniref:Uncharacterized protein n=1 Tax=Paraburkholderia caribensis MBA4 TaxID=1323664 RepID=A0A0P0RBD0_9BURK|nr:hypothetical protein [Paraburkholderia caribensis]ALL65537.1 hypothetical protein K788_0003766 [Paraburkholderia caribensis MBA4]
MRAVTGCNGNGFSGNGWQRSRAAAGNQQYNKGNMQGKAVMQDTLDAGGSAAR